MKTLPTMTKTLTAITTTAADSMCLRPIRRHSVANLAPLIINVPVEVVRVMMVMMVVMMVMMLANLAPLIFNVPVPVVMVLVGRRMPVDIYRKSGTWLS